MAQGVILIVEDEREIAELIKDYLMQEGYQSVIATDGEQGLDSFKKHKPILAILDIMLPKLDGLELCRIIRSQSNIPILMLSAKKNEMDKILGLGLGADDYITKPFSPGELIARVRAHIRRFTLLSSQLETKKVIKFGGLEIDGQGYNVFLDGEKIELSAKEFEILHHLALHPQQVFTREQIFESIWGYNEYGDINTVTVHIRKIREKIEKDPSEPQYIKTIWGVGYKFDGSKI